VARREQIIEVAGDLLERHGPDGLTMRAIAGELGIQAPSLYKHIANKRELEIALIADGLLQQAEAFEKVVADGGDPIAGIAGAYRAWAKAHPHLYRLFTDQPLPRDELPDGLEARAIVPLLEAVGGDMDRARALWAFAHGMVTLEIADRFPPDADIAAAWLVGIEGIASGITRPDSVGRNPRGDHS
jgi:AcrR family transcriptional regulator